MKIFQDQKYSFTPTACSEVALDQAEAVICKVLTPEIKQEKKHRPNLTIIQIVDQENWSYIFSEKIHLTVQPVGMWFNVYTLDGADYAVDKHKLTELILKLLNAKFYQTSIQAASEYILDEQQKEIIATYPQYPQHGQNFGTFAIRLKEGGFLTSTRGKKQGLRSVSRVLKVDHNSLTVFADTKATLNAPLLDKILELNPKINYLLHGHELIGQALHQEYEFAGTVGDLNFATYMTVGKPVLLRHHGFIIGFETYNQINQYLKESIWNNYRSQFPVRYFQPGQFDSEIDLFLKNNKNNFFKVLDIGGGEKGTEVLNQNNLEVYYLDPYVVKAPAWAKQRVDWDTGEKFDLIIARGCINYFTPEQLEKIPLMLNKNGLFMANTFLNPPSNNWQEKEVFNQSMEKGLERSRLVDNVVEHQIIFPNYQVNHSFFYYSLHDYFNFFKVLAYQKYGTNSVVLKVLN